MVTKAQRSKEGHIGDILAVLAGGYREGSGVHTRMWRDLRKLTHDNLLILAQSARKVEVAQKSQQAHPETTGAKICEHENLRCCYCGEPEKLQDAGRVYLPNSDLDPEDPDPYDTTRSSYGPHHQVHCEACLGDFLVPCED